MGAPLAVLAFLHGFIHAFSVPAAFGMMPRFVARERLAAAIAVSSAYTQFAIFAGPALAGWIILHYGIVAAFACNVVGYLVYFATTLFLRTPESYVPPAPSGRSLIGDMAEGLHYILGHRGVSSLLMLMGGLERASSGAVTALDHDLTAMDEDALLQQAIPGVRMVNFGHLGDGNLHYNVQAPPDMAAAVFLREHEKRVNTVVFESVARFNGSISAEHGVGGLKVAQLEQYKSPVALDLMRAVKRALDPHNLMNPGRVLRLS